MSTFLQLLRVAFWMLPLQRAMTMLGAGVCIAGVFFSPEMGGMPGSTLPMIFTGVWLTLLLPLLTGGVLFRMLSTPRAILLLPHARGRLLTGMIGVALLATLLWIVAYWTTFQRVPVKLRPDAEQYLMMYVLTLTFATQCGIGMFIASRGPLWALLVICLWQLPGLVLQIAGRDDVPQLLTGPAGIAMAAVSWVIFGIWYLRARRIHSPAWSPARAAGVGPVSTLGETVTPLSREKAMERWLLGASSPLRIALQWLLAVGLLVGVQLLLGRDSPPRAVAAMLMGTLSLSAVVFGAIAFSIAARSRGLWLTAGRDRRALHAWCERLMLRVIAATAAPFLALGAAVWWWLPARPSMPGHYLLFAAIAPGLAAAWAGLMQVRRQPLIDAALGIAIVVGWYLGLVKPLSMDSAQPGWGVLGAQLVLIVTLRQLAVWRWRGADWPRAQRVEPLA